MKTFALLSGLVGLHQAAAVCCRSNQCLKAILNAGDLGIEDCASNLAVTVTPVATTLTETGAVPTAYETDVTTQVVSTTETTTASTETDIVVISSTVVDSTETQLQVLTQTTVATVTVTPNGNLIPERRHATGAGSLPAVPTYLMQCPSWEKYTSACKCASVTPVTITAEAPSTTVTVDAASTSIASVLSTLTETETVLDAVTATVSATETDIISITATVSATQTTIVSVTTSVPATQQVVAVCNLTGLYSNAQCCATDVLGVADINCTSPPSTPLDASNFSSICASSGRRARCCVIPVLGQAVLCESPAGIAE